MRSQRVSRCHYYYFLIVIVLDSIFDVEMEKKTQVNV